MLDNKNAIYSDCPILPVGGELIGWKIVMTLLPYGDCLHRHCQNFYSVIGIRTTMCICSQVDTRRFLNYYSDVQFFSFRGIHLAEASLWLPVPMSLAVFNISKVIENGIEISLRLIHCRHDWCSIEAHLSKAVALIEQDLNY
ncbi:hypothetical protein BDR04DRAFT_1153895 [Suillus decipiens]|nr:hypothetical protein BDR04DRAFT_1153895 [Suillus decipiens]